MIDLDRLRHDILQECHEDYVGLWDVLWQVRYALNEGKYPLARDDQANPAEVRRVTLEIVKQLLESALIQAGFPTPDGRGFEPWSMPADEIMARIHSEWTCLGREPNIGEITWFKTTDKGDQEIESRKANEAQSCAWE